ncbi:hypothetical protein ACIRJS_32740 [Streptomyces sp. NPDC102340]|nr:hypothetical protein [Streptomyces sp. NBC_01016]MCX4827130.1 hypothetical protein [Streptomyces sp. NBC_01016]MCX4832381.1 hypothetical protein [Streptomyces sp. NBC_01016]
MLTWPIALGYLALFGLGCVLVCWSVDRHFPMNDKPKDGTR